MKSVKRKLAVMILTVCIAFLFPISVKASDTNLYSGENAIAKGFPAGSCETVDIRLVTDLMCLRMQQLSAQTNDGYDFRPSFQFVKPIFEEADFAIGNLETILCDQCPYTKDMLYREGNCHCNGPTQYLDALKYAGFDGLVLANNHSADWWQTGIDETKQKVDSYGFLNAGTHYSSDDVPQKYYFMLEKGNVKIAVLTYTEFLNTYNEISLEEMPRYVNLYREDAVKRDVESARAEGADYIIAYNHWGNENTTVLTSEQLTFSKQMAEAGCDLIIGSHSHCLQGTDVIITSDNRKVPCFYSLGNFVSSMATAANNDTVILDVKLKFFVPDDKSAQPFVCSSDISYIPCHSFLDCKYGSCIVIPVDKELNGGVGDLQYDLEDAFGRIRKLMKNVKLYTGR